MQGEAVKANIRSAMDQVFNPADGPGENAQHSTNFKDMVNVIDGAGTINIEGEFAKSLLTLNEQTEIAAIGVFVFHVGYCSRSYLG